MIANKLKVSLVQTGLVWEDAAKNRELFEDKLNRISENTDLVVLPEMFSTGFTMSPESLAETMSGKTMKWLKKYASKLNSCIVASLIIKEKSKHYNRLVAVNPQGEVAQYDKRHLFRMGNEQDHYEPGKKRMVFEYKGWRICPLVCYDLRFPVWSRNKNDYDLLIYIANWPESRREVWKQLLVARAIENQSYVIGVNRIGEDGMGLTYSGDSMVISPKGVVMSTMEPYTDGIVSIELSMPELVSFKEKFPAWMDADDFEIV